MGLQSLSPPQVPKQHPAPQILKKMKPLEMLYFNRQKYHQAIVKEDIDDTRLAHKINRKREKLVNSKTKLSISIVATICTLGLASPTALLAARSYVVRCQKVDELEKIWGKRGSEAVPQPSAIATFKRVAKKVAMEMATLGMDTFDVVGTVADNLEEYLPGGINTNGLPSLPYSPSKEKKQPGDKPHKKHSTPHAGDHKQGEK